MSEQTTTSQYLATQLVVNPTEYDNHIDIVTAANVYAHTGGWNGYGVYLRLNAGSYYTGSWNEWTLVGEGKVLQGSDQQWTGEGSTTFWKKHEAYHAAVFVDTWGESVDGYGAWGGDCPGRCEIAVEVPALESHTVSFNANGGTGAPSSVTKWRTEMVTIPSTVPTRTNYEFLGWSESKTAASASYQAGQSYWTADKDVTYYAVWKLVSNPPTVKMEVTRCNSSYTADSEGTYAKAVVTWSVDTASVSTNVGKTVKVSWSPSTSASSKSATVSAKSGTTTLKLGSGFDGGTTYSLTASVTDSLGLTSTTTAQKLGGVFHTFDIGYKGKSMGLGAAASDTANQLKIGFDAIATSDGYSATLANFGGGLIAARGDSGVWGYVKYANGLCICWAKSVQTAWNASAAECNRAFPFTINAANVHVSVYQSGTVGVHASYVNPTTSNVDIWATGTGGSSAGDVTFSILVWGGWK